MNYGTLIHLVREKGPQRGFNMNILVFKALKKRSVTGPLEIGPVVRLRERGECIKVMERK